MENINRKLIAFVLGLIVGASGLWVSQIVMPESIDATVYYAVFINNGQVYFGHMNKKDSKEIILTNVYYLQSENQEEINNATEPTFSLKKMGSELHGPTDMIYINRQNVLFYEELRGDSKVVKSIIENKQK